MPTCAKVRFSSLMFTMQVSGLGDAASFDMLVDGLKDVMILAVSEEVLLRYWCYLHC